MQRKWSFVRGGVGYPGLIEQGTYCFFSWLAWVPPLELSLTYIGADQQDSSSTVGNAPTSYAHTFAGNSFSSDLSFLGLVGDYLPR